jgi:hypothetical protein
MNPRNSAGKALLTGAVSLVVVRCCGCKLQEGRYTKYIPLIHRRVASRTKQ